MRSQSSRVRRRNPAPSAPSTHATGPLDVGVEQALAAGIGAENPDALLLHVPQRAREIGHRDHRDRVGGAARGLGHRRVDADRAVLRHDDRMRAERVGAAQAGAEIVRVGHAVQNQQQRRFGERIEDVVAA